MSTRTRPGTSCSIFLSVSVSICLSVCLSVSVSVSVCLSLCLSVSVSLSHSLPSKTAFLLRFMASPLPMQTEVASLVIVGSTWAGQHPITPLKLIHVVTTRRGKPACPVVCHYRPVSISLWD